jgi:hypothetical protein
MKILKNGGKLFLGLPLFYILTSLGLPLYEKQNRIRWAMPTLLRLGIHGDRKHFLTNFRYKTILDALIFFYLIKVTTHTFFKNLPL